MIDWKSLSGKSLGEIVNAIGYENIREIYNFDNDDIETIVVKKQIIKKTNEVSCDIFDQRKLKSHYRPADLLALLAHYFDGNMKLPNSVRLSLAQGFTEACNATKISRENGRSSLNEFLGLSTGNRKAVLDRMIYDEVVEQLSTSNSKEEAYKKAARELGLGKSSVDEAFRKIVNLQEKTAQYETEYAGKLGIQKETLKAIQKYNNEKIKCRQSQTKYKEKQKNKKVIFKEKIKKEDRSARMHNTAMKAFKPLKE